MINSISLLLVLLLAATSAHAGGLGQIACGLGPSCGRSGRRLNQADNSSEPYLRLGSINLASIGGQPLLAADALFLSNLFDSLVIRVKVLSIKNTVPSAALNANLTRDLSPSKNVLSVFFSNDPNASAYTFDDKTGLVSVDPVMNPIMDRAYACHKDLTPFDFCPLLNNNVMLMKVGFLGYLDPLGILNSSSAAKVIRKAALRGLIGSVLDVQVGKLPALDAYFNQTAKSSSRNLMSHPMRDHSSTSTVVIGGLVFPKFPKETHGEITGHVTG
jgi:hypothetical protein